MKDLSKMEGKTNFSRRLKQFDGLTWLTPIHPLFYDRSTPLFISHFINAITQPSPPPQKKEIKKLTVS